MSSRPDAVQRIIFGSVISPRVQREGDHSHGHIIGLGQRPKASKGGLSLVRAEGPMKDSGARDSIYAQLESALPVLRKFSLPEKESPFSDKEGHLSSFAENVFGGIAREDITGMTEALIENRPYLSPEYEMMFPRSASVEPPFRFDPEFLVPDSLPSAGSILSESRRVIPDEATGGSFFHLAHPMEPYLISVAALRARGINAYPAHAVIPAAEGEHYHPLVVIADLAREVPLITFDLLQIHPPMGSVDIMSDVAVKAVTYTMLAEARIKHLTTEMVIRSRDGAELPMEELMERLDAIADSLFECHRRWPGCHFISNALAFAVEDLGQALMAIHIGEIQTNLEAAVRENPQFAIPGVLEQEAQSAAVQTAANFAGHIQHQLAMRVARYP